ncbi:MAG: WG repeat-containing protein [Bacteroidota bacterium]
MNLDKTFLRFPKFALIAILLIAFTGCGEEGSSSLNPEDWRLAVELDDKWGAIDREGNYVLNPIYPDQPYYWEEHFTVFDGGTTRYFDKDGNELAVGAVKQGGLLSGGLLSFSDSETGLLGFMDAQGEVKIKPAFQSALPFTSGRAAVTTTDDKLGVINQAGKFEIEPEYDAESSIVFFGDYGVLVQDAKSGYLDRKGKVLIPVQFDLAFAFANERAVVSLGDGFGVIDTRGKFVVNPIYRLIYPFIDEVAIAANDQRQFLALGPDGKVIEEYSRYYPELMPYREGKIPFENKEGKWGYLDLAGEEVIAPQFRQAYPFLAGVALVEIDRKYGLIGEDGKVTVTPQFSDIDEDAAVIGYGPNYFLVNLDKFISFGTIGQNVKLVAETFLVALAKGDYAKAKRYATKEAQASLEILAGMSEGKQPQPGAGEKIVIRSVEVDGDSAVVTYTDEGKEMTLNMVREYGEWRAAWSK